MCRSPLADQTIGPVHSNMVLVAERKDGEVDRRKRSVLLQLAFYISHRLARIPVLLREPRRVLLPAIENAPFLEGLFVLDRVAPLGRCDNRSADDLSAHRQEP